MPARVLALEVIDNAPCSRSAPLYVKAMEIGRPGEVHHALRPPHAMPA